MSNKNKKHFDIVVFMAVLVGMVCLTVAVLLGNIFIREYFTFDKDKIQASKQTAEQTQASARTYSQKSEDGQVLNIYGEPVPEPKPRYIPENDTEAETEAEAEAGSKKGKSSKKGKTIYLEAIDNSNVHTEAGQEYPSVDVTEIGEKLKYLGKNEYGWLYVETEDGNKGYVYLTHFADVSKIVK